MYSPIAGKGQVIAIEVSLPNCQTKSAKFPYLNDIPDEIKLNQMEEKCIMSVLVKEQYLHIQYLLKIALSHYLLLR